MATCQFQRLPSELICRVLVQVSTIGEASRLARASRELYRIWIVNARLICSAVMPRTIVCFEDAQALLLIQDHPVESQPADIFYKRNPEESILIARRLRRIAISADWVCSCFERDLIYHLSPQERTRLIHNFYTIWKLSLTAAPSVCETLAKMSLRQLVPLFEISALWMTPRCFDECDEAIRPKFHAWEYLNEALSASFNDKRVRLSGAIDWPYLDDQAPAKLYSVYDQYQESLVNKFPDTA